MTPERFKKITRILSQRQHNLTLVLDEVHKGRNLSAIMRSADAHGIDKMHCIKPDAGFKHYRGTALGSHKWVQVSLHDRAITLLNQLKANGYQIVATSLSARSRDYRDIDYTVATAIVLGTENNGVSDSVLHQVDHVIAIPMVGMAESLNVSVACGIILAEAQRQRSVAGMYASRQLPEDDYKQRLFQWCYPELAQYCDQRGFSYPELDEEGAIINGVQWYEDKKNQVSGGEHLDKTIRNKL